MCPLLDISEVINVKIIYKIKFKWKFFQLISLIKENNIELSTVLDIAESFLFYFFFFEESSLKVFLIDLYIITYVCRIYILTNKQFNCIYIYLIRIKIYKFSASSSLKKINYIEINWQYRIMIGLYWLVFFHSNIFFF